MREWLKGESVEMMDTDEKDNGGGFPDPARAYFNDALVPVVAGHARVHGLDAKAFANFLTARTARRRALSTASSPSPAASAPTPKRRNCS